MKPWLMGGAPGRVGENAGAAPRGENTGDVGDCKTWLADIAADSKSSEGPRYGCGDSGGTISDG